MRDMVPYFFKAYRLRIFRIRFLKSGSGIFVGTPGRPSGKERSPTLFTTCPPVTVNLPWPKPKNGLISGALFEKYDGALAGLK